jgi:hypothetical protein
MRLEMRFVEGKKENSYHSAIFPIIGQFSVVKVYKGYIIGAWKERMLSEEKEGFRWQGDSSWG